jgi:hypothetical protein
VEKLRFHVYTHKSPEPHTIVASYCAIEQGGALAFYDENRQFTVAFGPTCWLTLKPI